MSLNVTSLTASKGNTGAGVNNIATASISPAANSEIALWVGYAVTGGTTVSSVSGAGLTWTQQKTVNASASTKLDLWTAPAGAAPASGAITITFGTNAVSTIWDIDQITGADAVTPLVASNTISHGSGSGGSPSSLAYNAAAKTGNRFLFACVVNSNVTQAAAETPAWTQLSSQIQTGPSLSLETQVSPDVSHTSGSSSWTGSTQNWGTIGAEAASAESPARALVVGQAVMRAANW